MKRVRWLTMAVFGFTMLAAGTLRGDVNDTWDWKNDPATGKPKRKLAIAFDAGISNFLAATGYSLEDIVQEAAANWNQHKSVSGWEFVFTNDVAAADVVIMSGDSPVPNGGASTGRGTNSAGVVMQGRITFDPTPQAKKRDAAGRPVFDPKNKGKPVLEDLTWGTNGVGILDLITVTKHEFSHLLRKKHNVDSKGREPHDTGNLTDPVSKGNHQREPSAADVTNITISATQAVKTATGTITPGVSNNIIVPKTRTGGARLIVPDNPVNVVLSVTPLEGIALANPDGLWSNGFERVALGVEIAPNITGVLFTNPATATLSYDDALWEDRHFGPVDEATLLPFRFDPGTSSWEPIPLIGLDTVANTISFPVSNLNYTVYGIAGQALAYTSTHTLVPYVSDGDSAWVNFDLYVLDLDAGMTAQLTTDPAIDNHPDISPDGKWVVWSSTRGNNVEFDIYRGAFTNLEATAQRLTFDSHPNGPQTTYPDRHPHFHTQDSSIILFSSKNRPLTSAITIISECSSPKIIVPPRYYEGMNVIRVDDAGTVTSYQELDIRDAWNSAVFPTIWTNNTSTYVGHPSFSHAGDKIVFSASIDGDGKVWEVYTVGFDTNTLSLIPNSLVRRTYGPVVGSNPIQMSGGGHFSEDDSEILFSSTRTPAGNSQIFSIPATGVSVPVTAATQRTSHAGNDYVPEPLMGGGFLVTSDLGSPGMCGQPEGPTRDLDIVWIDPSGTRTNLTDNDASDEMALIGDEVSWFCGLSPNLSACRSVPRIFSAESLWLERSAGRYLKGLLSSTPIPSNLLSRFGYPDQAVRMYAQGWVNMESAMSSRPAAWSQIMTHMELIDLFPFPGLGSQQLQPWLQYTAQFGKFVSESIMYDRGVGMPWQPWVSTWTNAAGGNFSTPGNWDLGTPGSGDIARFYGPALGDLPSGGIVRADVTNKTEVQTIEIEMVQLSLTGMGTNPPTMGVASNIYIGGLTGITTVVVSNITIIVTNRQGTGEIRLGTNGMLTVSNSTVKADRVVLTNDGSRVWVGGDSFFDVFQTVDLPPLPDPLGHRSITLDRGGVLRSPKVQIGGGTGSVVQVGGGTLIVTNAAGTGTVSVTGGSLEIVKGTATVDRVSLAGTNSDVGVWNVDSFFDITYSIDFIGTSNRLTVGTGAVARCPFVLVGNAPTHAGNGIDVRGGTLVVTNSYTNGCLYLTPGDLAVQGGTAIVNRVIVRGAASGISLPEGRLEVQNMTYSNGLPLVVGDGTNGLAELITDFGGLLRLEGGLEICRDADLCGNGVISLADTAIFVQQLGGIRPGKSPGILMIEGSLAMADTATLWIELGGLTAGTEYDRLAMTGHADLNGKLSVTLTNGFTPSVGDAFEVLTYGSQSNAFATVDLPPVGPSDLWHVTYGSTSVTLRVLARTGDFDGDDMPNGWEYDHFGSATAADANAFAANGVNTVLEAYIADLDPNDPTSVFPPIANIGDPVWILEIAPTSTGRIYDVDWSTNLLQLPSPWTAYGFDRPGTGSNVFFVITNVGPVRFYRTGVRLP